MQFEDQTGVKLVRRQCSMFSPELQRHPSTVVLLHFMLVLTVYRTESETVPLVSLAQRVRPSDVRVCAFTPCVQSDEVSARRQLPFRLIGVRLVAEERF